MPVSRFTFEGNTLLSSTELAKVVAPWLHRQLTLEELQYVADAIAERYRRAGYLVRAYLPQQDVDDGSVRIAIIEARLGDVSVDDGGAGSLRLSRRFARDTVGARQRSGDTLRLGDLERGSQILADTPGVSATTLLTASETEGHTDVVIRVTDEPLLTGSVTPDSFGSRSTGTERLRTRVSLDNLSGFGDQLQFNAQFSSGSQYGRLRYSLPVGRSGLRAGASISHFEYELGGAFSVLDSEGTATSWGVDVRYPLIRASTRNLNITGRFDHRAYRNRQLDQTTSNKRVHALTLGASGDVIDAFGGGGFNLYSLSIVGGDLDLAGNAFDHTIDSFTARRHGKYAKVSWSLGRLQHLTDNTTLWASLRGQLANDNLDSSEGFSLGGPAGVRAYPVLEAGGDQGWLSTLELRHRIYPDVTLMAFYDHGRVRQHKRTWNGWNAGNADQPLSATLKGAGIGVIWARPGNFSVNAMAARRVGSNPLAHPDSGNDSDGSLRANRFWLSANKYF